MPYGKHSVSRYLMQFLLGSNGIIVFGKTLYNPSCSLGEYQIPLGPPFLKGDLGGLQAYALLLNSMPLLGRGEL
jgi:hypothetical protein